MSQIPYRVDLAIATAAGNVNSAAYQLGDPDVGKLATSILCPHDLKTVASVKVQVSPDNVTYYDIYPVTPILCVIDLVIPIPDFIQAGMMGWDYIRLVADTNPSANITFIVHLAQCSDDNPVVAGPTILAPSASPVAAGSPLNATSVAYEASRVIKATPGVLYGLTGYNSKGSAQFIQLYNSATLPADTAVPVFVMTVPTVANFSIPIPPVYGRYFSTGIVVGNSSTGPTKTIGGADCWFDAQYR